MEKTKKAIISVAICLGILVGIVNAGGFLYIIYDIFISNNVPQITYGEFPFYVEYEKDGEKYVIEDTVICEFTGFDNSLGFQTIRIWSAKLKSGDENKCILKTEENAPSVLEPGRTNILSRLVLDYGSPEYYMDDPVAWLLVDRKASFEYREMWENSEKAIATEHTKLNKRKLEKYFDIKIIKFEFSKPIKNRFE